MGDASGHDTSMAASPDLYRLPPVIGSTLDFAPACANLRHSPDLLSLDDQLTVQQLSCTVSDAHITLALLSVVWKLRTPYCRPRLPAPSCLSRVLPRLLGLTKVRWIRTLTLSCVVEWLIRVLSCHDHSTLLCRLVSLEGSRRLWRPQLPTLTSLNWRTISRIWMRLCRQSVIRGIHRSRTRGL